MLPSTTSSISSRIDAGALDQGLRRPARPGRRSGRRERRPFPCAPGRSGVRTQSTITARFIGSPRIESTSLVTVPGRSCDSHAAFRVDCRSASRPSTASVDKTCGRSWPFPAASASAACAAPRLSSGLSISTILAAPSVSAQNNRPPLNGGKPTPKISPRSTSRTSRTTLASRIRVASSTIGRNSRAVICSWREFLLLADVGLDQSSASAGSGVPRPVLSL